MLKSVMMVFTAAGGVCTAIAVIAYTVNPNDLWKTLAITCGTVFYHFSMRLSVGAVYTPLRSRIDCRHAWFRPKPFEKRLYKMLRVKRWKDRMPTYDPAAFDVHTHSLEDMLRTMCHSELVHETIVVLSFVPLLAAIPFGAFSVFLITSLLAAAFDMLFVVLQRYNRPRLTRVIQRTAKTDRP